MKLINDETLELEQDTISFRRNYEMNTALKLVQNGNSKRDYINKLVESEPKTGVLFTNFINQTVTRKSKRMGESYRKNYDTLVKHINDFSSTFDANIFTNSVNEDFMDDFICFLEEKNLKQSYICTLVSLVKSMASKAAKYGYAVDLSYDDVQVKTDEPFSIYLSMNEITRIYYFKGLTKKQERIRDLFIIGCLTALRYSDYSTLTRDNFTNDRIVKITKKTGIKVTIPLHDYVSEIYAKYNGEISLGLSIQHFNRYIKMICKNVGFTDPITFNYTKGGKLITETKQKWSMVSSHTARRSAATNMYMTQRMKTFEIMALTGHTTEKSFFRYIRTSVEDKVKHIAGDKFFRK